MINLSRHQKDVHGMTSSQFLANSCSQDTVFSSIFSCVNNAGDLKMAARYFTLEEVLERVVNDEEVSDFDDESEEDLPDVSESENNGDSSESESEFIEHSDGSGRFVLFVYIWRKIFVIYE